MNTQHKQRPAPLTIVFVDSGDRFDGASILRSHAALSVQEFDPDTDSPRTLCGLSLPADSYRYAPSRQAGAFALCDGGTNPPHPKSCMALKGRRVPSFLGKPTRRAAPKLNTYTTEGIKTQHKNVVNALHRDMVQPYHLPIPSAIDPMKDDTIKMMRTRHAWLTRERLAHHHRRNRAAVLRFPQFNRYAYAYALPY